MKRRAEHKEPFVRMAKRASIAPATAWMIRGAALLGALLMGALLLLILGHEPLRIYREMARGAFGGAMYLKETARTAVPLLISAIGIAFAFKMQFWNIGAEGQILVGAIAASAVAIYYDAQFAAWAAETGSVLPRVLLLLLMFFAAVVAGGIYGSGCSLNLRTAGGAEFGVVRENISAFAAKHMASPIGNQPITEPSGLNRGSFSR